MVLTAPALSRKLAHLGYAVTSDHHRQGLRVRGGALPGCVSVSLQFDKAGDRIYMTADVARTLASLGYSVQTDMDADAVVLTVKFPRAGE